MMVHRAARGLLLAILVMALLPGLAKGPDERIAFQRNEPPAVTVMFADGTGAADIPPSRKFSAPCVTPSLSPDGRTLAFAAKVDAQFKIFTWRLDEHNSAVGEPKRLTPKSSDLSEEYPSWSPNGKQVAFLATDKDNKTTLRVVNADGSGMLMLANAGYATTPVWSPDGKFLLYIDLVGGKPTLSNIYATGGRGLPIRGDSITGACYLPDGKQLAVLVQKSVGISDLCIIPPFGAGGRTIVRNIVGAKGVGGLTTGLLLFNAAKVGTQGGKAFWTVDRNGAGLKGITGYADPKTISYFSVQKCDLSPYVPPAINPLTQPVIAGAAHPTGGEDQEDLADILAAHAITMLTPADGVTVQGAVPLHIIARKNVANVTVLVNGQLLFATSTLGSTTPIPKIAESWNTQEIKELDPAVGFPDSYTDELRYPDGTYTLCAQARDEGNKLIDQHIISVTVQNTLPDHAQSGFLTTLQYPYTEKSPSEYYRIHGEGTLLGMSAVREPELHATLDAALRRTPIKPLPNNTYGLYLDLRGPHDRYALTYGRSRADLTEFATRGACVLNQAGDLTVASHDDGKAYLPLGQLSVPFPNATAKIGESWSKPMWVVTDLLDREATQVMAEHTLDGMEWIDGHQTVRIRSTYHLTSNLELHTTPSALTPGARGTRTANPTPYQGGGSGGDVDATIIATKADGVRYSWFDLDRQRLVRVDDRLLYTIPFANLPSAWGATPTGSADGSAATYYVHYLYKTMPAPTTEP
jgi:hypothetical protein